MASRGSSTTLIILLMALCLPYSPSLLSLAQISTISAAPALLPTTNHPPPPLSSPSPALSPDITPLFPSPGGDGLSPTESSLPIIPSSPSPPNPDDMAPYGPNTMAISPSGSLPDSSSPVSSNSRIGCLASMVMALCLMAFW